MAKRIHANGKASVQARFNISVINPIIVKALLRVEGKSDQGDAMTLARLAANFDLKASNMPDSQQREPRLLFKRIDRWKQERFLKSQP